MPGTGKPSGSDRRPSCPLCNIPMLLNQLKNKPIQYVKGVGEKRSVLFHKLEIRNLYDLLTYYPYRYENRKNLTRIRDLKFNGEWQTVFGTVIGYDEFKAFRFKKVLKIMIADETGHLSLICYNRHFLKNVLKQETKIFLSSCRFVKRYNEVQTAEFDYEAVGEEDEEFLNIHTNRIVPIYRTTEALSVRMIRSLIYRQLKELAGSIEDPLPEELRQKYRLKELPLCLYKIHFPASPEEVEIVRRRLAFDRFFFFEMVLALIKQQTILKEKKQRYGEKGLTAAFRSGLPFTLTADQEKCLTGILEDMNSAKMMNRLLMGDVGSGKTIVALISALHAVQSGYQAAFMVPTEILAQQHFLNITRLLKGLDVQTDLLISKLKAGEKKRVLESIGKGESDIVIGTHALIEEAVKFANLKYVIIDEQHRFGVLQRAQLHLKAETPDILVMTATPIPRTLSLTVFGDLDISVIREMPPGRKPITTLWYRENRIDEVYQFLRERMRAKEQVYVVYPLVSESDKVNLKDAQTMYMKFKKQIFRDFEVGLIHGQMKREEKEEVMARFRNNDINLLVATTVIEVGVDVANASVMVIEHAERFGIAQLHQLRGRIGRSGLKSTCILVTGFKLTEEAVSRMRALLEHSSGFLLAEKDLELRGPGELMGTRQSGLPDLKPARLLEDRNILEAARGEAFELVRSDPDLSGREKLKEYLMNEEYRELHLLKVS